jgi:cytoskeletal protein RodZ
MELRRRGVGIGETLAQARDRAGLTISQVSQQTRIRGSIIADIEGGDFRSCGGDFYARGHIRSIARTVGADPGPLVEEYDATRGATRPVTVADMFGPVRPVKLRERRRVPRAAVLGLALLAAAGVVAYHVAPGLAHPHAARPAARVAPAVHRHVSHVSHAKTPAPVAPYAHTVVIDLTAIEDCWVGFTTSGGGYLFQSYVAGGTSKTWTFPYPVAMRLGNPGGITLAVDGKNPLPPGTDTPITLGLGLNGQVSVTAH